MEWLLERMFLYPRRSAIIGGIVLVLAGVFVWWQAIWQNPQHIFEDMLTNNLATNSVTKLESAGDAQQGVVQLVRLQMGSTNASDWLVSARQNGASVTTESIGTATTGFIRYIDIAGSGSKPATFARVLNVWAESDHKTDASLNDLFSQTLLDISNAPNLPIAHIPSSQRENLLSFIRDEKVFTPDYAKAKHETVNGHSVLTFPTAVKLAAYVRLMQAFAHDLGIKDLDNVDPSSYAGLQPVNLSISVDQFSHQLVKVSYPSTGFSQSYSDWGLVVPIERPTQAISTTELQHRLQAIKPS